MSEFGPLVRSGHTRRIGRGFRFATVLVLALSCAPGDAGTLLGPIANPLDLAVVQVTPEAATIPSGGSFQFTALAILPDNVAVVPDVIWTATGGTISASGLFIAGMTPGTYQISAQIRGGTRRGSAPVNVAAPSLTSLVLTPATVALAAGATQQFSVGGTLSDGSATVPAVAYTVTGGTMTSGGLYTAGTAPGTFTVIATQQGGSKADTAIVNIAAPAVVLLQMVLAPSSLTLAPGGTGQFAVAGTWSDGTSSVPVVTYVATGGTISAGGLYTAGTTSGTFRVIATQQGGTKADTAIVMISVPTATLLQMILTPVSLALAPGGTAQFGVAGAWSDGSASAPAVTYSATGGTITVGGLYTAGTTAGTFRVIATQQGGTKADTAAVTVAAAAPTLTQLILSPASLSLAPGGTAQFAVSGMWSDGSTSAPAVTYSATGGTITVGGLYTAGAASGTFRVIATQQGGTKADTSAVTIAAQPPTLTQMVLSPASLSLASGATGQFAVAGTWSDGSTSAPAVTYSATGGTITAGGLYTAGATAGTFRVIATQQGGTKADTSAVTIAAQPPTLTQMVLSPASLSLAPGATGQFTVAGTWSDGSTSAPAVTYSATGGTITAGGLYTAGAASGTFRVIATQQGGTKADTSVIMVTPALPTALALMTQPAGAVSGVPFTQQPVVQLRNGQNQPVQQSGVTVTASEATGTGTLSGQLSSTTNAQGQAGFSGLQITGAGSYTITFAAPGLTPVTSATFTLDTPTLRSLASARGFSIGTAVRDTAISGDAQYRQTLITQYNSVVPEDETDFYSIHPAPTQYNFAPADRLVAFAQANGMAFHGHSLTWYSSIPTWVTAGGYTNDQLRAILKDHITTIVSRYRGKVASWDAVNEVESDYGTGLRSSFWVDHLGAEYIDSAFVWAHRADPAAKLFLNEYATETINVKSTAILALVEAMRARGVPIDGVGFQVHIYEKFAPPTSAEVQANFQRFANAGFDIRITEMDVEIADTDGTAALASQAAVYGAVLDACLKVSRCTELTTWGFTDRYSWIPIFFPGDGRALPFDANYQPKPAFNALLMRLSQP